VANALASNTDLFGARVDGTDGPEISMRPVARRKPGGSPCVREMNDIITESITTKTERQANYVQQGWSLSAIATTTPWTTSRMTNNNARPIDQESERITKRFTLRRLAFNLRIEDLEPIPEFETDVKKALAKPNNFERFHALYRVLHIW
jgi:hypothetical protein